VLHAGSMARIFSVHYAEGARDPGFQMVMKVPRMIPGDGAEHIIGFETEHRLLPLLTGPHVPRFVACGDLAVHPYLVLELVPGRTYQQLLDETPRLALDQAVSLGIALARACHSLHRQNVVHQDLKPANVVWRDGGIAVLLDFGLSHHAELPDLLAEETRQPIGTHAYMAPEQVLGIRGDSRSDLFAIGVMLYEMLTGELPFGDPKTAGGLRQRLWMDPVPPRRLRPDIPAWLQEVVLRLLEPQAEHRYPSAKHLVFDLENPGQVAVTARGQRLRGHALAPAPAAAGCARPACSTSRAPCRRARSMKCPSSCWRCPTATSATARSIRCARPPRARWARGPARAWLASP
jgi:serine/threonine protein kinase